MNKLLALGLKTLMPLGLAASVAAVALAPTAANATPYVVKVVQQGGNVVATGSGSFDLTGLTLATSGTAVPAQIWANQGSISTTYPAPVSLDAYTGYTGPTSFGVGDNFMSTSGSGDFVGIFPTGYTVPLMFTPAGYVSGDALSSAATWDGASFASLGIMEGIYVWTWGNGADQSFTLDIASVADVPEPAALGIFGFGVLLLGALAGLRRRIV